MLAIPITVALFLPVSPSSAPDAGLHILKTREGYRFYDGKALVLFYRTVPKASEKGTHSRSNYCHPVYGIDGRVMTEDFPADHLHQRGVFWAWHQVTVGTTRVGDMWDCRNFVWDVHEVEILEPRQRSVALRAKVYWKSPLWRKGLEPFAEEAVTIRVHGIADGARAIDFRIELLALVEGLRIGGADNDKGYGGFSTRIVMPRDITMNDHNGRVVPKRTAVPAGNWMNFRGTFGKAKSDFAILVHPSHPGGPRKWILRRSRSAQNVAYPGRHPVPVLTAAPLVLRYRLILHSGADLDRLFQEYVAQKDGPADGTGQ